MTATMKPAVGSAAARDADRRGGIDTEPEFSTVEPAPAHRRRARRLPTWWPVLTIGAAIVLWGFTLAVVNTNAEADYGLVTVLPVAFYAALILVTIGFAYALHRDARMPVMLAHIAMFILLVHGTPAIAYAALRYSWAWKHVGIVDLLHRHHAFVPSTPVLPIYQQWPGFFAAATALTEAAGLKSALTFAAWAPPVFELLDAAVLVVLLGGLTEDRRRVALGVWFFVIANWVAQDYFAPQAFGFFLFLVVFAIIMRWYRRPVVANVRGRARSRRDDIVPRELSGTSLRTPQRRTVALVLLVLMAATATSHPLTPLVICACLGVLTLFKVLDRRWPLVAMVLITGLWLLTGARDYTSANLRSLLSGFGQLSSNVDSNLANLGQLSPAQHVVANMGRLVVLVMVVLAVAGLLRRTRRGYFDRAALLMCVAPGAILAGGSYGGEAIFRVYLFALPFAAFLGAGWFFPSIYSKRSWRTPIAIVAVSGVLIAGFTFAYFGKDTWSYYTPSEVKAAEIVYTNAPPGSLLIAGTLSYPVQFKNAENFTYVTLAEEPPPSIRQVLADPVKVLHTWMADTRFTQGYLIITRAQIAESDSTGELPRGSLQRIERLLLASHDVQVLFHDRDALLVTVARQNEASL